MKPNYKELCESYQTRYENETQKNRALEERLRSQNDRLIRQEREIDNIKIKYAAALDKIIALQELIVTLGETNEQRKAD